MPPIVKKPPNVLDLGPVDADPLIALATRVSNEAWAAEDARKENKFDVFHDTQHMIFRFIPNNADPKHFYQNPSWELWKPALMPVIKAAIAPYNFRQPSIPKAMLAKLSAGAIITPHRDGAGSNLRVHKIHVPLVTNPDATFQIGQNSDHLEIGRAYEVNNVIAHGARNDGSEDRIHFIFEVFDSDYDAADRGEVTNANL